jgi:hypothetical protein
MSMNMTSIKGRQINIISRNKYERGNKYLQADSTNFFISTRIGFHPSPLLLASL